MNFADEHKYKQTCQRYTVVDQERMLFLLCGQSRAMEHFMNECRRIEHENIDLRDEVRNLKEQLEIAELALKKHEDEE